MPYFPSVKSGGGTYSTSEVLTGETWIDGKPIYRKVVDIGSLPNNATKTVAHGITGISQVITLRGMVTDGNFYLLPMMTATGPGQTIISVTGANITIISSTDRHTLSGFVILEYTKTS